MTIEGIVGLPGMGKTYLMVHWARKASKKGTELWANFDLDLPNVHRWTEFGELFVLRRDSHRNRLILLDEASLVLPQSETRSVPIEVWAWLRQSRHKGTDMFYTAQSFREVAPGLRNVTQYVTKVKRWGLPGKPFAFSWKSREAQEGTKMGSWFCMFDPQLSALYDTHGEDVGLQSFTATGYGAQYMAANGVYTRDLTAEVLASGQQEQKDFRV